MLNRIKASLEHLSPSEKRVAKWVLANPKAAVAATLAEVSTQCAVSDPTVIRFCRRVGLSGFREMAIRLTEALSRPTGLVHRHVSASDSTSDAAMKVLDASIQSLLEMRSQLSAMPIDAAVAAMTSARQIAFAGLGASGHVASDACHKFFRLGVPCSALSDSPTLLQFAAIAEPSDVLFLLSHTGRWQELATAAKLAMQRDASVIAVTNPDSVLANECNLLFPTPVIEDTGIYTPMSSRLAQLALLDAIQVALALAKGEAAVARLRLGKAAIAGNLSF